MRIKTKNWDATWDHDLTESEIGELIDNPYAIFDGPAPVEPIAQPQRPKRIDWNSRLTDGLTRVWLNPE